MEDTSRATAAASPAILRLWLTVLAAAMLLAMVALGLLASSALASSDPALDAFIEARMDEAKVPGLQCCIVKDGHIVFATGYGWADIETETPMTPDSVLEIASISKTFTATAAMQCVERGILRLDKDVKAALGWSARNPRHRKVPITLKMLMTHTSSITDSKVLWDGYYFGGDSPIALDDWCRGYLTPGGDWWNSKNWGKYAPGAEWSYSNAGAATCGDVVEQASGTPFDAWCDDHIFGPLGMRDTSWRLRDLPAGLLAMPYYWEGGDYLPYGLYGCPDYPDSMVHTSANQLGKFLITYLQGGIYRGHRILDATTVDMMLTPFVPGTDVLTGKEVSQGLFWHSNETFVHGRTLWGHSGADLGISSEMYMDRSRNEGVIVLANGEASAWNYPALAAIVTQLFQKADQL